MLGRISTSSQRFICYFRWHRTQVDGQKDGRHGRWIISLHHCCRSRIKLSKVSEGVIDYMKNLILKYKYILLPVFLVTGSIAAILVINIKPELKPNCNSDNLSMVLSKSLAYAALPPENKDQADLVITGSVCEIVKVYNDGDKRRQDVVDRYGTTKGISGSSYLNSMDIKVKISKVVNGEFGDKLIVISTDGSYGDEFRVGDTGTFFIKKYDGTKYRMLGNTFTSGY